MPLGINKDFKPGLYISVCLDMVALALPPEGHPIVAMAIYMALSLLLNV
jgi:hypothetical protein